jgi:hypothetical protein
MQQRDADRPSSDRGIAAAWTAELQDIFAVSAKQRAHAKRQRDAARWMREEADAMRIRTTSDWPRPP